jgi:glycosyltransferase involved in cell wall biosynthesis
VLIEHLKPDLIHAMRIPYEGMLTALAAPATPWVISVWGNDFTLHARANPWMARLTRQALARASGLHADCRRDQRLACEWGFDANRPAVVLPGNGGIDLAVFYPANVGERAPWVINPRGVRSYVRNDTFFRSIPLVLRRLPQARFICPAMAGEAQALGWVDNLNIAQAVDLLPRQPRPALAHLFRRAAVVTSITEHDGTPNTLLEALACGCYPVAGDIESLREWITPGVNGSLAAPDDFTGLAEAILEALDRPALREVAADHNIPMITERAEYGRVMAQAEAFYGKLQVES